ncbi:hypothetical protein RND81_08G199800 [Saponaria officinalis]|uniref:Transmembrane protein n=1 Tax=Saponaria officinalis TaxID=3572 RepID=A0AAW1J8W1_SAPOF
MNYSSKTCFPLLLSTLILALVATLLMTSNPVLGSRSLTRPSNRNNDVILERIDVHGPRKLEANDHAYPPQDFNLQPDPIGPGNYNPPGGDYNPSPVYDYNPSNPMTDVP